ncbi:hypothetical protein [Roseivivax sediminis]|uniref:Pre-peptidase C-terminal domain-containing protein n=1 Tax=Roseivivax sediminis TaxID=936889 RepID=A0A1I1W5E6_9RHOB|nr:hypothetical protein [Roseivivax sediminis]SFD89638.1 hypothetical protein SAMN04515678_104109 [Roseivivax sediminis]
MKTLMHFTLALSLALPVTAVAQEVREVHFGAGNFGTMIEGTITGHDYLDYRLGAGAGQQMFVELAVTRSDGFGNVNFNVMPPGAEWEVIYISSNDGNSATVDLPEDGTYTIRVYHLGNDEDAGATSAFTLDLSIQ